MVNPENKWGGPETQNLLLDHWSLFTLEHIAYFQHGMMEYLKAGVARSECVKYFTYKYLMEKLHSRVNDTYSTLLTKDKGGVTMKKIML